MGVSHESKNKKLEAIKYFERSIATLQRCGDHGSEVFEVIQKNKAEVVQSLKLLQPHLSASSKKVDPKFERSPYLSKKSKKATVFVSSTGVASEVWDYQDYVKEKWLSQ